MRTLSRAGADVEVSNGDATLAAYVSNPASGRGPGVLVLHEAFGLVDHVRDVCDRLAREGFVALAPDFFGGRRADTLAGAVALASSLEPEAVARDLEAATSGLLGQPAVEGARLGAIGFCMGGHLALLAASLSPRIGAAVNFYGLHPGLPIDSSRIEAQVLCIFAERDEFIPAERVESLREELEAAGVGATLRVQPGVGHAFMNDSRPDRHDAAAAAECWPELLAFLRAVLA